MALTKCVTKQILCSLEYLHDVCGIVHTDVEAIVAHGLTTEPSVSYDGGPGVIVVPVLFSTSSPITGRYNTYYTSQSCCLLLTLNEDSSPHFVLELIGKTGISITEFLMRFWLFEFSSHRDKWGAEEDHLVRMTEALATNFDPTFLSKCKYSQKFFNSDGCWKNFTSHKEPTWVLEELLAFAFVDLGKNGVKAAGQFLHRCLPLISNERMHENCSKTLEITKITPGESYTAAQKHGVELNKEHSYKEEVWPDRQCHRQSRLASRHESQPTYLSTQHTSVVAQI
ncbi:hypothetical protein EV368DRAFT_68807 [Lentinula lateritia]|nr:hypothetical protein EV368DRAFT_68807 [Lentinula lateritia]